LNPDQTGGFGRLFLSLKWESRALGHSQSGATWDFGKVDGVAR